MQENILPNCFTNGTNKDILQQPYTHRLNSQHMSFQMCQNIQCSKQKQQETCSRSTKTSFCSQQCAYIHTLNMYRQKAAESHASSLLDKPMDGSAEGCADGRWHTATLIRWGIDPWSPAKTIQMRRQCCQMLLRELGKHWGGEGLIDYAWTLENINYSLSYLPEYAGKWRTSSSNKGMLVRCDERYHYLCAVMIKRISCNPTLTSTFLHQAVHPIEFYAGLLFPASFR